MGKSLKLLHLNKLIEAINTDPDLSSVPLDHRAKVLQVVYRATGCDFTSFFVGIGKTAFLKYLYQYAQFITGQTHVDIMGSNNPESNVFRIFEINWRSIFSKK